MSRVCWCYVYGPYVRIFELPASSSEDRQHLDYHGFGFDSPLPRLRARKPDVCALAAAFPLLSCLESKVERILEYTKNVPQEAARVVEGRRPAPTWPSEGALSVKNLTVQ